MPENNTNGSQLNYQRIGMREFFQISWWVLSLFLKMYPVKTVIWILSSITNRIQNLLYTLIFAKAIDQLISVAQTDQAQLSSLYPYLLMLVGYSVITSTLSYLGSQSALVIRQASRTRIRQAFYLKLHSLGIETLEQPGINDKIARADDYLGDIMPFLRDTVQFIASAANLVTTAVLVLSFMPLFGPIILLVCIPYILFDKNIRMKMYSLDYENTEERRKAGSCAGQLASVNMLQEIISSGALKYLDSKYMNFRNKMDALFIKIGTRGRVGSFIFNISSDLVIVAGYLQIFIKLMAKTISVGSVLFWMRTLDMLQRAITETAQIFNDQFETSIRLKDTYSLFVAKSVFVDGNYELPKLKSGPKIEFKDVSFKYPRSESFVIEDLNLTINPGEKLAIVGQNGAGKTTLTKLISRFYLATKGEVRINDVPVNTIKSQTLYQNMGILFQDFNTYHQLTAMENIYIGRSDEPVDEVRVRIAAQTADAMDFISAFPNKFDQILDPKYVGGIRPSTGQWQKLAIARFFYRNSPLVIFDEPTASIDAVSEFHIFNKIYDFFEDKTVIIISHRFSTVRNADRIIVLDKGKIIEEGSHRELMNKKGNYYEAFQLQAKGYED